MCLVPIVSSTVRFQRLSKAKEREKSASVAALVFVVVPTRWESTSVVQGTVLVQMPTGRKSNALNAEVFAF